MLPTTVPIHLMRDDFEMITKVLACHNSVPVPPPLSLCLSLFGGGRERGGGVEHGVIMPFSLTILHHFCLFCCQGGELLNENGEFGNLEFQVCRKGSCHGQEKRIWRGGRGGYCHCYCLTRAFIYIYFYQAAHSTELAGMISRSWTVGDTLLVYS